MGLQRDFFASCNPINVSPNTDGDNNFYENVTLFQEAFENFTWWRFERWFYLEGMVWFLKVGNKNFIMENAISVLFRCLEAKNEIK